MPAQVSRSFERAYGRHRFVPTGATQGKLRQDLTQLDSDRKNAFITLRARLKCPSFSSGFGSSCLSNFLKWAEPEVFGLQSVEESGWAVNFIRELPRPILKTEIVRQTVANGVGLLGPIAACLV